jgi:hypothetical protein
MNAAESVSLIVVMQALVRERDYLRALAVC